MAITSIDRGGLKFLFGLAADVKPTDSTPAGSKFVETDTGDTYTYTGASWIKLDSENPLGSSSSTGAAADNAAASGNPVRIGGVYNTTPPTYDNGDATSLQSDVNGNLKTVEGSVEYGTAFDAMAAVSVVAKNAPGYLRAIYGVNRNAAARYLQLHNTTAVPAAAAVPIASFYVKANDAILLGEQFFGRGGRQFTVGITVTWSTTEATYTAATPADHSTSGMVV